MGNQPEFGCELVEHKSGGKTLVITLPNFATSGCFALVNLRDLTVEPVNFKCTLNLCDQ